MISNKHFLRPLFEVLKAREARASVQQAWLSRFEQPMVSTTLVWPGEVKDAPLARRLWRRRRTRSASCGNIAGAFPTRRSFSAHRARRSGP
ncbi:MAG: citrate lyase holo-[acyl-carrier protein] synthase [Enterobacteriaceae bacterium]